MPEGDTIHRLAERIETRLAGQVVTWCATRDPRLVGVDLTGATLASAEAVGKHLLVRFTGPDGVADRTLHAHLRMDGRFVVGRPDRGHEWRRRIELRLSGGWLTGVDVPVLAVIPTADEARVIGHLGPDLTDADAGEIANAAARLGTAGDEPLAGALLDQRLGAGLGNVFAVELPFLFGLSPFQPVGSIDGLAAVVAVGAALLRDSAARGRRNTTGRRLHTSDHWAYGGRGGLCPVCGAGLRADDDPPWRRVTVWCPTCQPDTDAATADLARARRLLALHPARKDPVFPAPPPPATPAGAS